MPWCPQTGQRIHSEWHETHNDPTPEVEVGNWPAANLSGDTDFRTGV